MMRAVRRQAVLRALLMAGASVLFVVCVSACDGCGGRTLAELTQHKGTVERDLAASVGQWSAAQAGATFLAGDGLRTGTDATALLRVGRKGRVHVESETTIRFSPDKNASPDAPPALEIEAGEARVEAGDEELALHTELGRAVLRAGGSMALSRAEGGTRYRVLVGGAMFDGSDGRPRPLAEGESIMIGLGTAVFEAMPAAAGQTAAVDRRAAAVAPAQPHAAAADAEEPSVTAFVRGVVRRRGAEDDDWAPLAQGSSELRADDELEVAALAEASLQRGRERAVLGQGRFQVGALDAPIVRALDGNVQIESDAGQSVRLAVPGGTITALAVAGGTRARVSVQGKDGRARIEVERGQVKAASAERQLDLSRGERGELAMVQRDPAEPAAAQAAASETRASEIRASARPEVVVSAGELFRVYDPKPPTVVGFKVGKACGGGAAEVRVEGLTPVQGRDQVNVAIGPGIHDYAVHCLEGDTPSAKAALRTKARIVRNDGARRLPMTPPKNDVSIDGRRYTLMYQNLKPILTAKWRDAPQAPSYVLHVTPPNSATLSLRSNQPQYVIPASALKDGTHRLQYETVGKSKTTSKETLVDLMFDNAAPTASLELPPAQGFARSAKVIVAGVVVEGSRVSVDGRDLPLDAQHRFRGEVAVRADDSAIAVRVQHPKHGIRYYLRRALR
jgi:hypothetical protein